MTKIHLNATPMNAHNFVEWAHDRQAQVLPILRHLADGCKSMSDETFVTFTEHVIPRLTQYATLNAMTPQECEIAAKQLYREVSRRQRKLSQRARLTEAADPVGDFMQRLGDLSRLDRDQLETLVRELGVKLSDRQALDVKGAAAQFTPAELDRILRKIEGELDKRQNTPAAESVHPVFGKPINGIETIAGRKVRRYQTSDGIIMLYED